MFTLPSAIEASVRITTPSRSNAHARAANAQKAGEEIRKALTFDEYNAKPNARPIHLLDLDMRLGFERMLLANAGARPGPV
jgi:hypothetical protein